VKRGKGIVWGEEQRGLRREDQKEENALRGLIHEKDGIYAARGIKPCCVGIPKPGETPAHQIVALQ